jgi:4-alpha-glucanotransferase
MSETPSLELRELARSYGVHLDYIDMSGQTKHATSGSLLSVLKARGAEIGSEDEAPRALRERRLSLWRRRIEPIIVAWEDTPCVVAVRLPMAMVSSTMAIQFWIEQGEHLQWAIPARPIEPKNLFEVEKERFALVPLPLPHILPRGYHRLRVAFDDGQVSLAKVIAAPRRAFEEKRDPGQRRWGVFCPLYAFRQGSTRGVGDFSDLETLIDWTAKLGGEIVATLPMLASTFDGLDPIVSPYSPVSKLFWNEFYLDLERAPELARCPEARALLDSEQMHAELDAIRGSSLVDYGRQMRLKRSVLEHLTRVFFDGENDQAGDFYQFVVANPEVTSYAFFQAAGERHGRNWRAWPPTLVEPAEQSDIDVNAYHYHLYAQWETDRQLRTLATNAGEKGLTWYIDFPIGVDFNSFDVWKHRDVFATGASVGCPPDPVFVNGQNWGFPPLHPDRERESGYAYLISTIRNHLKYAKALRIDHVMGLHRLFWVPEGAETKDGAFVSTPAEEIYAILSLESHRHSAWLVGEDLGTVPVEVDAAMKEHNVRGMYVVQYEVRTDQARPLREPPEPSVASLNTHDMPPFASFWSGIDLDDRKDLGLLSDERLSVERWNRGEQRGALTRFLKAEGMLDADASESDTGSILRAALNWLAESNSSVLLVTLEDLWLETEPQNTPNTYFERPNWRRKIRRVFEEFADDPAIVEALKKIDELRSGPAKPG